MQIVKRLLYYCHRFRDPDPDVQAANLERAGIRFLAQVAKYRGTSTVVWAPWIAMAEAGVPENLAWPVITAAISASAGIVVDFDGAELSEGMAFESELASLEDKDMLVEP